MELWPAHLQMHWRLVTDTVMGGVSHGTLARELVADREAIRMRGDVSTANNGGFIQIALDLAEPGTACDASRFTGIELDIIGNGESYAINLRTTELTRPQQSYRHAIVASSSWTTFQISFSDFLPHRTELPLNVAKLRRAGVIAIGRDFHADLSVARLGFY